MSFRKLPYLLAALLLTFGASDIFAQPEAVPRGVRVRLVSPDSASYAGIDKNKTIKVEVLRTSTLAPVLSRVIVALGGDTLSPRLPSGTALTTTNFSADSLGFLNTRLNTRRFVDTLTTSDVTTTAPHFKAGTGGVDTFKFTFTVTAGDPENERVVAVAYLTDENSTTAVYKLNTLNTTPMSATPGFTDPVGGKRFIKLDGLRPVNGTVFDSVLIDTLALKGIGNPTFGTRTRTDAASTKDILAGSSHTVASAKIGDKIKLKMHIRQFNAATAEIGIYSVAQLDNPDSSMYLKSFPAQDVVSATNGVKDSFNVVAGQFKAVLSAGSHAKDNLRTKVVAFLVDNAGNRGAASATATSPVGFSQDITYVLDSNAPTVKITYPDSTTRRFTGLTDTSISYRTDAGTQSSVSFAAGLKPLQFGVSNEGTTVRWAIVGKDTASYGGTSSVAVDGKFVTVDSFAVDSKTQASKGGKEVDLKVVAKDSVGNAASASVAKVIHDQVRPEITDLFPTTAALPEDTINNNTRHPVFQISEVADTISVRFVQSGATPPDVATQSVSAAKLSVVGEDIQVTVNDTLIDKEKYTLQIFIRDLAGNVNFTSEELLTYDAAFNNPTADSFIVTSNEDSVLAGQGMKLTVTAIDSKLTRQASATRAAVTYEKKGTLVSAWSGSDPATSVSFWGKGVTDNGNGTANLDGINWDLGARDVYLKSNMVLDNFSITVEDTSTTIVDGNATKITNFRGDLKSLYVDAADMRKYWVQAWEDGKETALVAGAFNVSVIPVDSWGNPSMKAFVAGTSDLSADSLNLLDTRLATTNKSNLLGKINVVFSSNLGGASVPSGPQEIKLEGATFSVVAPNADGEGLMISVNTANVTGDDTGLNKQLQAKGSVTVSFQGGGIDTPVDPNAPAAPANLVVQDYMGAGGGGDQGFYVMVSFPHSADHGRVAQYRLYRELDVNTGLDANGNVTTLDTAMKKWVAWTAIDAIPAGDEAIARAVVPVTDNMATRWAVSAEGGAKSSEAVVAGKRVFTKESVQMMAQFFGVDPNRIVNPEDLGQMFMPSADYIKSIIGDQKNVVFAALDPNVSSMLGVNSVPQNIRTQSSGILSSARTMTENPVAAKDNLAPAAVAEAKFDGTTISWTPSVDDRTVGYVNYRGFAIPIAGVAKYEIWGGSNKDALEIIGTVPAGTNSFKIDPVPAWFRVDALDLDNMAMGTIAQGPGGVITDPFTQWKKRSDGKIVYIIALNGGNTPNEVDLEDFIAFAQAFGVTSDQEGYNIYADMDQNGKVNFADFVQFAIGYGLTFDGPATKPVILPPGVNENAEFSLRLGSDRVLAGEIVSVDVALANVQSLIGYGFTLNYDADKFEFVDATPADQDLLTSTGGETPVFFKHQVEAGRVTIANAVVNGAEVSGGGDIVRMNFRVLQEFEENARFEVAEGLVFDPQQLSNPAVIAGVLNIQSTPTEFALLQNFPNPFNPETTIGYNLSESADVKLQIYNVVGQVVRTLVAEPQSAGRYQVRWNGMDDRGVPVSSGIYFYQIAAGKFQDVRKLMLLK